MSFDKFLQDTRLWIRLWGGQIGPRLVWAARFLEKTVIYLVAVALWLALFTLIVIWSYLNLWSINPSRYFSTCLVDGGAVITYPNLMLANGERQSVIFSPASAVTTPETVTVMISGGLYLASPEGQESPAAIHLAITNSHPIMFWAINPKSDVFNANWFGEEATLTFFTDHCLMEKVRTVAETGLGGWLRRSAKVVVDGNSLLVLSMGAVFSTAYAFYKDWRQAREAQAETQRRAEKRNDAEQAFRQAFLADNRLWAEQALRSLQGLESPQAPLAEELLKLARGEGDLASGVRATNQWPQECYVAYLRHCARAPVKDDVKLRLARQFLPPLAQVDLGTQLAFQQLLSQRLVQTAFNWELVLPDRPRPVALRKTPQPLENWLWGSLLDMGDDAQQEQGALFDQSLGVFWAGHPVLTSVRNETRPYVVGGSSGSGRTALALFLEQTSTRESLTLYMAGQPTFEEINRAFARRLLAFLKAHPDWVSPLLSADLALLGGVLAHWLGPRYALAELQMVQGKIKADVVFFSADRDLQIIEQKAQKEAERLARVKQHFISHWPRLIKFIPRLVERWRKNRKAKQTLLSKREGLEKRKQAWEESVYKALQDLSGSIASEAKIDGTVRELSRCAQALGFQRLRLLVDGPPGAFEWWQKDILPHLMPWGADGLQVCLFAPSSTPMLPRPASGLVQFFHLKWEDADLLRLAQHRVRMYVGRRRLFDSAFELPQGARAFCLRVATSSEPTPRGLLRRWRRLTHSLSRRRDAGLLPDGAGISETEVIAAFSSP
jgi:hypothetical protein